MTCRPSLWWWGLPGVVALWLLALLTASPRLENAVATAATAALEREVNADLRTVDGRPWARLAVSGRDVALAGEAPSEEARRLVTAALDRVNGVRVIGDGSQLLPARAPFVWAAERDGNRVTLSGYVPPDGSRSRVVEMVKGAVPDAQVTDRMEVARGDSPAAAAARTRGVAVLSHLASGRVAVSDGALTVAGRARDAGAYDAAMAGLRDLPAGVTLASPSIARPPASPFMFSVGIVPEGAVLAGFAPAETVRDRLIELARARSGAASGSLQLASGAMPIFAEAAAYAIDLAGLMSSGAVRLSDGTLSVDATARDAAGYQQAASRLAQPPAGVTLGEVRVQPPLLRPYATTVEKRRDGSLLLRGAVPDDATRLAAVATARTVASGVEERLELASGAPAGVDFGAALRFAIERVAGLRTGRAELVDATLTIEGETDGPDGLPAARAALQGPAVPAGLSVARAALRPGDVSPYRFEVRRRDGSSVLAGYVPDEDSRRALLEAARTRLAGDDIEDQLVLGTGAPPEFRSGALAAIRAAARLASGTVILNDRSLTIEGEALTPGGAERLARGALDLPSGFTSESRARPTAVSGEVDAARCGELVSERLGRARIEFETGSARIDDASEGLLETLAAALLRCPSTQIEVAGHTDDVGEEGANERLSNARADAVATALAEAGVPRERIAAAGYGAARPLVPNDSDNNRARNRRIEIDVRPQ